MIGFIVILAVLYGTYHYAVIQHNRYTTLLNKLNSAANLSDYEAIDDILSSKKAKHLKEQDIHLYSEYSKFLRRYDIQMNKRSRP